MSKDKDFDDLFEDEVIDQDSVTDESAEALDSLEVDAIEFSDEDELGAEPNEGEQQQDEFIESEMAAAENSQDGNSEDLDGQQISMGEGSDDDEDDNAMSAAEGSELDSYESAEIEEKEFVEEEMVVSIIESILFSTDRPQSLAQIKQAFKGTTVKSKQIKRAIESLAVDYASGNRGVTLEEVTGGYQLRTKVDNLAFMRRMVKARSFRLSGPALEVLAIVAYKQPCTKADVDEIRGVESGHLLRGLMDRSLVSFAGKSDLPGKPMLYQSTRKFLEIFGLRNLQELPSLREIDDLIPEGIGETDEKEETLEQLTDVLSKEAGATYSEGEEELEKISHRLSKITTTSNFFEEEKRREKEKRDAERAQDIRDALTLGDEVADKDRRWLERYEQAQAEAAQAAEMAEAAEMQASTDDGQQLQEAQVQEPGQESHIDEADLVTHSTTGEELDAAQNQDESDEAFAALGEEESLHAAQDDDDSADGEENDAPNTFSDLEAELTDETFNVADAMEAEQGASASEGTKSSTRIGEVDFSKLEEDLEIFDEDPTKDGDKPLDL